MTAHNVGPRNRIQLRRRTLEIRDMRTICECGSYAINDDPEHERCDLCWRDREIARLRALCREASRLPNLVRVSPDLMAKLIHAAEEPKT